MAKLFPDPVKPEEDTGHYFPTTHAAYTVASLVAYLQTLDPSLPVAYKLHSEQCLLEEEDIEVVELCEARPDGWVQNKRPDKPTQTYLLLPGN